MVHPIQKEQYGSFQWLKQEVGFALGLSRDPGTWDHQQHGRVESIVQSGVMQFYFPPPLQDVPSRPQSDDIVSAKNNAETEKDARTRQPYLWSWLSQMLSVETKSGVYEYDLPEDFVGPSGDLVISTGEGRLPVVSEEHLRAVQARQ
jgi:hypothetical protein